MPPSAAQGVRKKDIPETLKVCDFDPLEPVAGWALVAGSAARAPVDALPASRLPPQAASPARRHAPKMRRIALNSLSDTNILVPRSRTFCTIGILGGALMEFVLRDASACAKARQEVRESRKSGTNARGEKLGSLWKMPGEGFDKHRVAQAAEVVTIGKEGQAIAKCAASRPRANDGQWIPYRRAGQAGGHLAHGSQNRCANLLHRGSVDFEPRGTDRVPRVEPVGTSK